MLHCDVLLANQRVLLYTLVFQVNPTSPWLDMLFYPVVAEYRAVFCPTLIASSPTLQCCADHSATKYKDARCSCE